MAIVKDGKMKRKKMVNLPERSLYHWLGEYLVSQFAVKFYIKEKRWPTRIGNIVVRKKTIKADLD